jgi:hypothetical protein
MSHSAEATHSSDGTSQEKFLFAEYQALITIDGSRNDRLDRFLTIFMTLAAAPWALYALAVKDHSAMPSLWATPVPVSAALVLIGLLGWLVVMMFIQMRFTIIMYTRVMNAIRGYFLKKGTLSYSLPLDPSVPPFYERFGYIQIAVAGMSLVNSAYICLGLFNISRWPTGYGVRVACCVVLGVVLWILHMAYYWQQAKRRERHSKGHVLRWSKVASADMRPSAQ